MLLNFRLWQEFVNSRGKQIRKKHSRPGYWSSFLSYGNANLESLAIGLWQRVYSRCEQIGSFRIGSSPCKFILLSSCFNQGAKARRSNESPTADSIATPPPIPTTCQAKGQDRPTTEEKEQSEHESNAQNSQQWKKFFTLQLRYYKDGARIRVCTLIGVCYSWAFSIYIGFSYLRFYFLEKRALLNSTLYYTRTDDYKELAKWLTTFLAC